MDEQQAGEPPLLALKKVAMRHTRLDVQGLELDTVARAIVSPRAKVGELYELLIMWPRDLRIASKSEFPSFVRELLSDYEAVRSGTVFVQRMPNQSGMPLVQVWHDTWPRPVGRARLALGHSRVHLGSEFPPDLSFRAMMVANVMGLGGSGTLYATLRSVESQPQSYALAGDASGDAMGGSV